MYKQSNLTTKYKRNPTIKFVFDLKNEKFSIHGKDKTPTLRSASYYVLGQTIRTFFNYFLEHKGNGVILINPDLSMTDITDKYCAFCEHLDQRFPRKNFWTKAFGVFEKYADDECVKEFYKTLHWPKHCNPSMVDRTDNSFQLINYKGKTISDFIKLPVHVMDFGGLTMVDASVFDILDEIIDRTQNLKSIFDSSPLTPCVIELMPQIISALNMYKEIKSLLKYFFQQIVSDFNLISSIITIDIINVGKNTSPIRSINCDAVLTDEQIEWIRLVPSNPQCLQSVSNLSFALDHPRSWRNHVSLAENEYQSKYRHDYRRSAYKLCEAERPTSRPWRTNQAF